MSSYSKLKKYFVFNLVFNYYFYIVKIKLFFTFFLVFFLSVSFAQEKQILWLDWSWQNNKILLNNSEDVNLEVNFLFDGKNKVNVNIENAIYENCTQNELTQLVLSDYKINLDISVKQGFERNKTKVIVDIIPFVLQEGVLKKLVYAELIIDRIPNQRQTKDYKDHSILNAGDWYKISVTSNGIHRLDFNDLVSLGLDVQNLNPNKLSLYGMPGGMLPLDSDDFRYDDLQELPIQIIGAQDNSFDLEDYVLFYGQGPDQWNYNVEQNNFEFSKHLYDDATYYFLSVNSDDGNRINNFSSSLEPNLTINSFRDFVVHELDEYNFVQSGRTWYGDKFGVVSNRNFNFNFPNLISDVDLRMTLAARTPSPYTNEFVVSANGLANETINVPSVSGSYTYAYVKSYNKTFNPNSSSIQLSLSYNSNFGSGEGYVDKIELEGDRQLKMVGNQMNFRSVSSIGPSNISQFNLSNASSNMRVWDVSDPFQVKNILSQNSNSTFSFVIETDTLKEFIAFNGGYKTVTLHGSIQNQNLHALTDVDFLIVSHPSFINQANRLANIHRSYDNLNVVVVTPQQIYNEFSSGSQDVSAIRDFAKMLYDNQPNSLKYMLLFGDASYDPKNRMNENTNFIISYQSQNSRSFIDSYVSDDFFAILDDGENISQNTIVPFLDIGVGRFPVTTIDQARVAVDKVENYYSSNSLGEWRLRMSFVGDDNDEVETVHTNQAEQLADLVAEQNPIMNIDKLYLDSYEQVTSAGGQRCPLLNQAINESMAKGTFLVNYTGHGGELGWAHERILELADINSWENANTLPLFMTATCEFSRYDDPERVSAGEQVFLREDGGAIALLTTSRVVFTGSNFDMNESFFEQLFPQNDEPYRLGDVLRKTKNNVNNVSSTNHRNFTLLGNPALALAFPKYDIVLTEVQDSAKALGKVTLSGEVQLNGQKINDFNGFVYPSVFDKKSDYQTLQQDESPLIIFDLQKNLLFKGKSSVVNGEFTFSFVVPRDLNYDFGNGKISLYASGSTISDSLADGAGYNLDMIIGGTADDFIEDYEGPLINLYMNDTNFESGDITNEEPSLLAVLHDANGINTVGNGIGHDVTAILDEKTSNPIILNDFYQSDTDSYQSGKILYPFNSLSEGRHTLSVKVWDVFNNSSEDEIEFVVIKSNQVSIQSLLNVPNPVIDYTDFYFDHNQDGNELDIILQIVDIQGRIVHRVQEKIYPSGFTYGPIRWNGTSEYNHSLLPGTYVYTLFITREDGEVTKKSGRLILLK